MIGVPLHRSNLGKAVSLESRLNPTSLAVQRKTEMMAKAARLNTELKFHELVREKSAVLEKQKDELKRLQIIKQKSKQWFKWKTAQILD